MRLRSSKFALVLVLLAGLYAGMWIGRSVADGYLGEHRFFGRKEMDTGRELLRRTTSSEADTWQWKPVTLDYEPLGPEFTDKAWWEQFDSNRTLYLAPYTGLCNTLQAMASVLTLAYRDKFNVRFVFHLSRFGGLPWEEMFAFPLVDSSTTFPDGEGDIYKTSSCANPLTEHGTPPFIFDERDDFEWTPLPDAPGEVGCVRSCCWREPPFPSSVTWFFRILRPAAQLENIIHGFKKRHDWTKYQNVGIHIRRTDNMETMTYLMGFQTVERLKGQNDLSTPDTLLPLQHYVDRMKQVKMVWPWHELGAYHVAKPLRFFLATDNEEARSFVLEQFEEGEIIFFEKDESVRWSEKDTDGNQHGIIDLYLLASCKAVIGTPFSTYSETASIIGGNLYLEPEFKYNIDPAQQ